MRRHGSSRDVATRALWYCAHRSKVVIDSRGLRQPLSLCQHHLESNSSSIYVPRIDRRRLRGAEMKSMAASRDREILKIEIGQSSSRGVFVGGEKRRSCMKSRMGSARNRIKAGSMALKTMTYYYNIVARSKYYLRRYSVSCERR